MSKEEEFYEIFRSKLTDRNIPVEEEDWRNMRKKIDDSRKRKKRIIWLYLPLACLLLGFGGYELYTSINTPANKPSASVTKNEPVKETNTTVATNTNPSNTGTTPVINKEEKVIATDTKPGKVYPVTEATKNVNQDKKEQKPAITEKQIATTNAVQKPIVASTVNKQTKTEKAKTETSSFNYNTTEQVKAEHLAVNQPAPQKDKTISREKDERISVTQSSVTSSVQQAQPKNTNALASSNSKNDSAKHDAVTVQNSSSPVTDVSVSQAVQPKNNSESTHATVKSDSGNKASTQPANNNAKVAKTDSTRAKADSSSRQVASLPPIHREPSGVNTISVELGAGYSLGWKYGDTAQGRGIAPIAGIGYTHSFNSKWGIKIGAQASAIDFTSTVPYTIKHTTYDFGYNSVDTTVTTKWLFYLAVPLQVEYKLDDKDAIGIGGSVSYLITAWGKISTSSASSYFNTPQANKEYTQYEYVKGFNLWNASVCLLYKRSITKNFSFYVSPYFGLMDMKSNTFFKQTKFERDSGIKILLSYNIF